MLKPLNEHDFDMLSSFIFRTSWTATATYTTTEEKAISADENCLIKIELFAHSATVTMWWLPASNSFLYSFDIAETMRKGGVSPLA